MADANVNCLDVFEPIVIEKTGDTYPSLVKLSPEGGAVSFEVAPMKEGYYTINLTPPLKLKILNDTVELQTSEDSTSSYFVQKKGEKIPLYKFVDFSESSRRFWVSVDKKNTLIKFGTGYLLQSNTLFVFKAEKGKVKEAKEIINSIQNVQFVNGNNILVGPTKYSKKPVFSDPPILVIDKRPAGLTDLSSFQVSELLPENQELYNKTAGVKFLTEPDDAEAINYSVKTNGCLLNKKLKEKEATGNLVTVEEKRRNYIRVEVKGNLGNSTGAPYVLEIWPPLHYSPVHNHGDAVSLIKVVHGTITMSFFNPLPETKEPGEPLDVIKESNLKEGQVTYMTSEFYQTHKVFNPSSDSAAVTLQCYQYRGVDEEHHPTFDYVHDNGGVLGQFDPVKDFEYNDLMYKVRQEYEKFLQQKNNWCNLL